MYPGTAPGDTPSASGVKGATSGVQYAKEKVTKQMNDVQFIFYALKKSFLALAFLRLITSKFGGHVFDDLIAAVAAMVVGTLLRHKTTRKVLPAKVQELWEPLRRIRKSRVLKLKASIVIDVISFAAFFQPLYVKMLFGKTGWTPVGVFLVQYLYESLTLATVNLSQICTNAANFIPTATLGWLDENRFVQKKEILRMMRDPALAKQVTQQFFKRVKEFWKEERERRKLGLSEEEAVARFAQNVSAGMAAAGAAQPQPQGAFAAAKAAAAKAAAAGKAVLS